MRVNTLDIDVEGPLTVEGRKRDPLVDVQGSMMVQKEQVVLYHH